MDAATSRPMASSALRFARAALVDASVAASDDVAVGSLRAARASIVHAVSTTPEWFTAHGLDQAHAAVQAIDGALTTHAGASSQSVADARASLRHLRLRWSKDATQLPARAAAPAWATRVESGAPRRAIVDTLPVGSPRRALPGLVDEADDVAPRRAIEVEPAPRRAVEPESAPEPAPTPAPAPAPAPAFVPALVTPEERRAAAMIDDVPAPIRIPGRPEPTWTVERIMLPNANRDARAAKAATEPALNVVAATTRTTTIDIPESAPGSSAQDVVAELMAVATVGGGASAVNGRVARFDNVVQLLGLRQAGMETALYVGRGLAPGLSSEDRFAQVLAVRTVDSALSARIAQLTNR